MTQAASGPRSRELAMNAGVRRFDVMQQVRMARKLAPVVRGLELDVNSADNP